MTPDITFFNSVTVYPDCTAFEIAKAGKGDYTDTDVELAAIQNVEGKDVIMSYSNLVAELTTRNPDGSASRVSHRCMMSRSMPTLPAHWLYQSLA